jgi:hypothetical protein
MEIRLKLVSGTSGISGSPVVFFWLTKVCIGVEWCMPLYPNRAVYQGNYPVNKFILYVLLL